MLTFKINQNLGIFTPTDPEASQKQLADLQRVMAETDDDHSEKVIEEITAMIEADPLFLRGYAMLGEALFCAGREDEATEVYVRGCRQALGLVPADYSGPMDMDDAEVQCFMRCHTGYVEDLMLKEEYDAAFEACLRQLSFDPEDMFERYREVGEMAVKAGRLSEAEKILKAQLEKRPTAWYSLGYIALANFDYAEAALRLRRAFVLAPYVADVITARFTAPNMFWEQGPSAPSYDEDMLYVHTLGGDVWCDDPKAQAFIEWLSQTSAALRERAEMVAISETCLGGQAVKAESEKAFDALWASIDLASSEKLTANLRNPDDGEEMPPWEYLDRYDSRRQFDDDEEEAEDGCGCGCGH